MILEHSFRGKIIKGSDIIDNLNFKFTIDKTYQKKILGVIKGTVLTYRDLNKFSRKLDIKDSSFSIKGTTEDNQEVEVQKCYFTHVGTTIIPDKKYEIEKKVAEIEADDFKLVSKIKKIPRGSLILFVDFLIDTRGILTQVSSGITGYYPNGSIKIENPKNPKKINTDIGQLSFFKKYGHMSITYKQKKGDLRYYNCAATFEIKLANSNNYNEKIEKAKEVLKDYLYLISAVSRKAITWYQCTALLLTNKKEFIKKIDYFKTSHYPEEYHSSIHDSIIDPKDFDGFLEISYPRYCQHKEKLKSILEYYVTSQEEKLMESSFLLFFIVLEALVNQFILERTETKTMKNKQFRELCTHLKPIISQFCDEENIEQDLIVNRLSELQRKPFLDKLGSLIQRFNIFIDDLYPIPENKFKFYKIRNNLIHRGKISDYYEFFKEKLKLQFLVERIILRILGWKREKFSTSDYPNYKFMS